MQIKADVVILGGGIQGLWLLADLVDLGYEALVLERTHPGCGQTGHAHTFLHEGHMHASSLRGEQIANAARHIEPFRKAHKLWVHELTHGRLQAARQPTKRFYIGFRTEGDAAQFGEVCGQGQIDSNKLEKPPLLFPGSGWTLEATGICLESQSVVKAFLYYKDLRTRVVTARNIRFRDQAANGFRVLVEQPRTRPDKGPKPRLDIISHAMVLSAGAGNERLIQEVGSSIQVDLTAARQQTVKTYMLAVKTPPRELEPVCGFFPFAGSIFLAHRSAPDGSNIWLVGDRQRRPVNFPGDWTALDARGWFRELRPHLTNLMPWLLENREHYEWGIYEAAKAEPWGSNDRYRDGGAPPQQHRVVKDPWRNVWAVWPSFLTLAPVAAQELTDAIAAAGIRGSRGEIELPDLSGDPIDPDPDRWQSTPLLDWQTFERCYA